MRIYGLAVSEECWPGREVGGFLGFDQRYRDHGLRQGACGAERANDPVAERAGTWADTVTRRRDESIDTS